MDPLWFETCWSTFKYFIILIVSTYYILCISWIIKCLIIIDAWCKHEDSDSIFFKVPFSVGIHLFMLQNLFRCFFFLESFYFSTSNNFVSLYQFLYTGYIFYSFPLSSNTCIFFWRWSRPVVHKFSKNQGATLKFQKVSEAWHKANSMPRNHKY